MNRSPFLNQQEALEFLKSIGMKHRRLLEGVERDHMLTILTLIGPAESSNNQRTFTETYFYLGKEYEVTYGFSNEGPEPLVEELTELI